MLGCGEPPFLERSSVPFLAFCVLYCISLCCIVFHCIVLYFIVLYCISLYCIVLFVFLCIVLYCILLCTVECPLSCIHSQSSGATAYCCSPGHISFVLRKNKSQSSNIQLEPISFQKILHKNFHLSHPNFWSGWQNKSQRCMILIPCFHVVQCKPCDTILAQRVIFSEIQSK